MWPWLFQQVLGAGKCHRISVPMESGGAVASPRMGPDGPKFLGSFFFFLWLGGNKSLLHLLFLLLKSHILGFEPMVSVTSVFFWKAPWQCQAGHTRWEPSPSQASSGHPSAC